jgi:hypothetical protein
MRYQSYSVATGDLDELESSAYVALERSQELNPAIYLDCSNLPSLTRQEFADECDINKLMAQFEKTGIFPGAMNSATPQYLDVSNVPDLMQAHEILQTATQSFMSLPATVRRDFDNDPIKFISFAENPESLPKLREWGLAPPPPIDPPPQKVEIVNPAPPQET